MLKNDITWEAPRYPPEPPWRRKELCVDISVSKEGNKKQNPEIIAAVANEKIDSSGNNLDLHIIIYTDASKTLDGKTSAAFCIPEFDFKCCVRLTNNITIFTAELAAIKLALLWILENKDSDMLPWLITLSRTE